MAVRRQVERDRRIVVIVAITSLSIAFAVHQAHHRPIDSDFAQVWAAARFLVGGVDPYQAIGPDRLWQWQFPLFYPMTAVVAALPFAAFPLRWADPLFVGLSTSLLAWCLTRQTTNNPRLCMFGSLGFLLAVTAVQWSPLMVAAALTPSLGFLLACKPSVGLALLCAYPSRRVILGAGLFGLLTILVWPWWVTSWRSGLSAGTHIAAPVTYAGGPLVLLALLDWRRAEARLLVALACIPQTPVLYETVPLFLLVQRWWEGIALSVLTAIAWWWADYGSVTTSYDHLMARRGEIAMWLIYLPCTVLVLSRKFSPGRLPRREAVRDAEGTTVEEDGCTLRTS